MNYPQIRFRDSFLLIGAIYDDIAPAYMPPVNSTDERHKLSRESIITTLNEYEKVWRPYEQKVVQGMCEALGIEFRQNVIDIYAAPLRNSFSFPVVIATKYTPERAMECIAHELIHVLLYDNTAADLDMQREEDRWTDLFPGVDDPVVLIHIPVHAALQTLFDDFLQEPERTLHDKKMCGNHLEYKAAWEYVDKVGYKQIIEKLKASYNTDG